MKITTRGILKSKQTGILLSILTFVAVATVFPHALAQGPSSSGQGQQGGIPLGSPYGQQSNPDPNVVYAWSAGIAVAAIMSGIGVWTAVRKQ